ncbi:MAG: hypothetical protein BAJATHORv1_20390 [Candidatus Thorarchaeota archaeon]|nr:MAG: hypothetical protein BAJATHORv1_20390 [Candidatus Thorarchaeota archaeon]
MNKLESAIKRALREHGVECRSVFRVPDPDTRRVVLAFNSKENARLTPGKVESLLNDLGIGTFKAQREFQRLSSAFLHLEVEMGARMNPAARSDAK